MRCSLVILFLLGFLVSNGQTEIQVHFSNGDEFVLPLSQVDSVVYSNEYMGGLPIVITDSAFNITQNEAEVQWQLVSSGGLQSWNGGVVYGMDPQPTVADNIAYGNPAVLDGLVSGETYYVRAFYQNDLGFGYGNEISFTTIPIVLPVLSIYQPICHFEIDTIRCQATIASDGGEQVSSYGFCWSENQMPTINDSVHYFTWPGSFYLYALVEPNTTYYIRAFASNSACLAYSEESSITTFSDTSTYIAGAGVTDIDGNFYESVILGNQEWTAENLKTSRFSNGDTITHDTVGWTPSNSPLSSWVGYDPSYEMEYGKVYNSAALLDSRGLCPIGWHEPSSLEWEELIVYLNPTAVDNGAFFGLTAGGKLKEEGLDHWELPNTGATNETGFGALPGGRAQSSSSLNVGYYGYYWSTTEDPVDVSENLIIQFTKSHAYLDLTSRPKVDGLSVRCVKD